MEKGQDKFAKTEPFPETNSVDKIGEVAGVEMADNESLSLKEEMEERDKNRWQLDVDSKSE